MVTERSSSSGEFFDVNKQTGEIMVIQPLFNDPKLSARYEVCKKIDILFISFHSDRITIIPVIKLRGIQKHRKEHHDVFILLCVIILFFLLLHMYIVIYIYIYIYSSVFEPVMVAGPLDLPLLMYWSMLDVNRSVYWEHLASNNHCICKYHEIIFFS